MLLSSINNDFVYNYIEIKYVFNTDRLFKKIFIIIYRYINIKYHFIM